MEITANIPGKELAKIQVQGDRIRRIQAVGPMDVNRPYISLGFIDIQLNGFAGIDFCSRMLDGASALRVLPEVWKTGVTTFCPTVITDSHEFLVLKFRALEEARGLDSRFARSAPCYHLEGPYISRGPSHGAHDPTFIRPPDWEEFLELQRAAGGHIGIVTLAPELPGAIEFIRRARDSGMIVALGHTDATPEQIHEGTAAGATLSTHLGNGLAQTIDRHQNVLWAQMASDQLSASMICDGYHLPRDLVRVILRAKGIDRCILVTDAVYVAGLAPGRYSPEGSDRLNLLPTGQVLMDGQHYMAGSSLCMDRAISIFMEFTGTALHEALRATTINPARLLPRFEIPYELAEGQPANLTLLRINGNALEVESVLSGGEVMYSRG